MVFFVVRLKSYLEFYFEHSSDIIQELYKSIYSLEQLNNANLRNATKHSGRCSDGVPILSSIRAS